MLSIHDIPGAHRVLFSIPGHAAGDTTVSHGVFVAPFDCKIRKVTIVADEDITGQNTNTFNVNLINRGTDGTGITELANRDYVSGTDESAYVERDLYAPSSYLEVSKGTVLDLQRELVGIGMASPRFLGYVEFEGH